MKYDLFDSSTLSTTKVSNSRVRLKWWPTRDPSMLQTMTFDHISVPNLKAGQETCCHEMCETQRIKSNCLRSKVVISYAFYIQMIQNTLYPREIWITFVSIHFCWSDPKTVYKDRRRVSIPSHGRKMKPKLSRYRCLHLAHLMSIGARVCALVIIEWSHRHNRLSVWKVTK